MVFEKIKEILAEQLDIENAESITLDSLLVEDLGADSLDSIDIVMSVEDEFKLEVPDEVIEAMTSVADIVNYIENNM
ncbi:acyl carrier protein [Clostridiales bacterium]|nr:acyl carrier protein [Eubacterium sp.]MDE6751880.1 acyl carrier protein [Eubacterium sp.]GFI71879.1 acyl carrier protein [Clostridiales bacterium]